MSDDTTKKRSWLPIALAASLALNLLVVGVVAGTIWRVRDGDDARIPPGFAPALYRALPDMDRRDLRRELTARHSERSRLQIEDFAALDKALRAVPFDPKAVEQVLMRQVQATAEMQEALSRKWLARISAMSDAARARYADKLEDMLKKGRHHKRKK